MMRLKLRVKLKKKNNNNLSLPSKWCRLEKKAKIRLVKTKNKTLKR